MEEVKKPAENTAQDQDGSEIQQNGTDQVVEGESKKDKKKKKRKKRRRRSVQSKFIDKEVSCCLFVRPLETRSVLTLLT